ncbi:MAG: hypothetical protein ACU841_09660 [Gammaproteobacteria bacterium]
MTHSKTFKSLAITSLAAVALGAGQAAHAHTGIKDQATEGKSLYTAFTITHGCNNNDGTEKLLKVAAQSSVFPNNEDSVAYKINGDGSETEIDLADHIEGANGGLLGLSPGMVQDKNVFKKQWEVTAGERVRGIALTNGALDTTAVGLIPFRVTAPKFKADSCAKSLKVRIAIANFCSKSKNTNKDNRSDIWIGHMTGKFNDPGVMPHDFETSPFWPTLVVNRTTPNNCAEGDQFDIAVQPSDNDIDNFLPVKGYWPQ